MELVHRPTTELAPAETLAQRRLDLHVQRVRSAAAHNPRLFAELIRKWLREDAAQAA
ncbi:MAG: hypothetical protein JO247_24280 [Chloroflexi bacterium]|nr:hypothetical protein [Chloroflexota bacterium]